MYHNAKIAQKLVFKAMKIEPVYMRYFAHGTLKITDGDEVDETSGEMIYEYNYMGKPYPLADV